MAFTIIYVVKEQDDETTTTHAHFTTSVDAERYKVRLLDALWETMHATQKKWYGSRAKFDGQRELYIEEEPLYDDQPEILVSRWGRPMTAEKLGQIQEAVKGAMKR